MTNKKHILCRSILSLRSEKPRLIISTRFEDEMVLSAALSE
jgi:hypothetical protein